MNKLEATGRLIQWVVELSEFDLRYHLREAIKAQALVDFITKFTPIHYQQSRDWGAKQWQVHVDGSSMVRLLNTQEELVYVYNSI